MNVIAPPNTPSHSILSSEEIAVLNLLAGECVLERSAIEVSAVGEGHVHVLLSGLLESGHHDDTKLIDITIEVTGKARTQDQV